MYVYFIHQTYNLEIFPGNYFIELLDDIVIGIKNRYQVMEGFVTSNDISRGLSQ